MAALTWADDPLVRLEIAITPALSAPIEILLKCGLGQGAREFRGDLAALQTAHDMLSEKAPEMMQKAGAVVDSDGKAICSVALDKISQMQKTLAVAGNRPFSDSERATIYDTVIQDFRPALVAAVNVYRRVFITMVLGHQDKNAKLTKRSTEELERISKQIFFVAINATVEAARLGDQGAALGHIGQEIRALSKSAQDMIEKMRTEH